MAENEVSPPRVTSRKVPAGRRHARKGQAAERSKTRLMMAGMDSVKDKQVSRRISE